MFCPHCGKPTPDDKPFCMNCGQRVSGDDPFRPGGDRQDQTAGSDQSDRQQTSYAPVYNGMAEPVRTVTFSQAVRSFFTNYANFKDRATRGEFWFAWLFCFIIQMVLSILGMITEGSVLGVVVSGVSGLFALGTLIPNLAISWRRLHDIGKSGGWWFLAFVPLVGAIVLLVFYCTDSAPDNQYGPRRTDANRLMYP
ncbi:DUF805 domain-containing protein [Evtepia sp.]|uniref:DUF805 domain-containing protein n=1 Tax=Evtepia sp. TaxID=2773933 RepID=UPI003F145B90